MLRKIFLLMILITCFGTVIQSTAEQPATTEVKLYFVDAGMMRLVPVNATICKTDAEHEARVVLNALIAGRDSNTKIRRLIPDIKGCLSVRTDKECAIVDIKKRMMNSYPDSRDIEALIIYQIVNSLTSIDGISNVKFTVNGVLQKDFMGYIDMRETFIPDYVI